MDKEQIKKLKEGLNDSFSDSYINNAGLLVHKLEEDYIKFIAYTTSWCLERKPFQLIEGCDEKYICEREICINDPLTSERML